MALAKQIGTMAKTSLSNSGHLAMHTEIYDRILLLDAAVLKLEGLTPGYRICLDREMECVNRIQKSATTAQLVDKDKERDHTYQFIHSSVATYKVCPDSTLRTEAQKLDAVLKAYTGIDRKAFSEETAMLDGLLHDLQNTEIQKSIKALHLDSFIDQLKTQNEEYKALDASRIDEYTARVKTDTTKARKATDETLDLIIQRVNALAVLEPSDTISLFIITVNQIFRKYKDLIAAKGGAKSPARPDDKPYPIPDPDDKPDNPPADDDKPDSI